MVGDGFEEFGHERTEVGARVAAPDMESQYPFLSSGRDFGGVDHTGFHREVLFDRFRKWTDPGLA